MTTPTGGRQNTTYERATHPKRAVRLVHVHEGARLAPNLIARCMPQGAIEGARSGDGQRGVGRTRQLRRVVDEEEAVRGLAPPVLQECEGGGFVRYARKTLRAAVFTHVRTKAD